MSLFPSARLIAPSPDCPYQRLALYAVRRMASSGIGDAFAAHAFVTAFGMDFRRPLILMRSFMTEMARASTQTIAVAPCCCPRVTAAESAILTVLGLAMHDPTGAHAELRDLLGTLDCSNVVDHARALAAGFADCGMPFAETC